MKSSNSMPTLLVVRSDASQTFQHIRAMVALKLDGDLELIWDRRTSDRRRCDASVPAERRVRDRREVDAETPDLDEARRVQRRRHPDLWMPERRQAERRRRVPDTWGTLGFTVVPSPGRRRPGSTLLAGRAHVWRAGLAAVGSLPGIHRCPSGSASPRPSACRGRRYGSDAYGDWSVLTR